MPEARQVHGGDCKMFCKFIYNETPNKNICSDAMKQDHMGAGTLLNIMDIKTADRLTQKVRRNHSRVVINELFRKAGLLQYLGGNKIASGSGLLTAIQRQPAILFQLDEFGMFLSAAADRKRSPRYVCEILDLMTELYTTAGTTYFGIEYASNQNNNAHQ